MELYKYCFAVRSKILYFFPTMCILSLCHFFQTISMFSVPNEISRIEQRVLEETPGIR